MSSKDSDITHLDLTPKLQKIGIVTSFVYDRKLNTLQLELNHVNEKSKIVITIDKDDWNKTSKIFTGKLKAREVNGDHIKQLDITLDNNSDKILKSPLYDSNAEEERLQDKEKEEQNQQKQDEEFNRRIELLNSHIPDKDLVEYVIKTGKKTVKQEDVLVRQIFYTGISAYSNDPINLGIIAPTSEGKTYPVTQCMKYFPKDDKWLIGKMSTKMLVRQKGLLVDENYEPLKPKINDIKYRIKLAEKDGDDDDAQDLKDELAALYERSRLLIDLTGKILVFLEPPEHELWNLLKPILSHDEWEIEYPYVEKTERGFEAKRVVVRGWPACIFCSAKDESDWSVWPEIVSRSMITSPNMNPLKYREANLLIAQRKGLPTSIQQQLIISDKEIEIARACILHLKDQIAKIGENIISKYNSAGYKQHNNPVWIPYHEILAETFSAEKGTDNRIFNRFTTFIQIVALTRSHLRYKLVTGSDTQIIPSLDDLGEVLYITQNVSSIPTFKLQKFKEWLVPLFKSQKEVNSDTDDKGKVIEEKIKGLTTKQMCAAYQQKYGKAITAEGLRKTYLYELMNAAFIDEADSVIDKRQKIYYHIIDLEDYINDEKIQNYQTETQFRNFMQYSKLKLPINCKEIDKDWLKFEILGALQIQI